LRVPLEGKNETTISTRDRECDMETLIIRVYRRSTSKPEEIGGLVETVGTSEKRAFQSFSGLIKVLRHVVFHSIDNAGNSVEHETYSTPDKKQAG
jgi:hypothetical protein